MKSRRILLLTHPDNIPPEDRKTLTPERRREIQVDCDVIDALEALGHHVSTLGIYDDLGILRQALHRHNPHITFNLLEEFHGVSSYDQNVVSYLELLKQHYTGCNPQGLTLSRDKAISKKLLAYHRISVPKFAVYARGSRNFSIKGLKFPAVVKSLVEEASLGISQASIVTNAEKLRERVTFIHESLGTAAIAEEYIEGREIYVGVLGNIRLQIFPAWELFFKKMPEDIPKIATERVKWSKKYQDKYGIDSGPAKDLSPVLEAKIQSLAKRIYRILRLSGYARIDFRMEANGHLYVLEANPNPDLAKEEDFAASAKKAGLEYPKLIQQILDLGTRYQAPWKELENR